MSTHVAADGHFSSVGAVELHGLRLMYDFSCGNPEDMKYKVLANRAILKARQKGGKQYVQSNRKSCRP